VRGGGGGGGREGRETQWRGCRDQWKGRLAFLNVGRHTDTQGEREGEKLFPEEEEEEEKKNLFFLFVFNDTVEGPRAPAATHASESCPACIVGVRRGNPD